MNWNIIRLDVKPTDKNLTNVVSVVHWECLHTEDGYAGRVYGMCELPAPETGFTTYNELTKEQILDWIWENGTNKEETEGLVLKEIENQKNPPIIYPSLPWGDGE